MKEERDFSPGLAARRPVTAVGAQEGEAVRLWDRPIVWTVPDSRDMRALIRRAVADRRRGQPISPGDMASLISAGLFDVEWYLANYGRSFGSAAEAIEHFRTVGCHGSFQPNYVFDNEWYLCMYLDVANAGVPPLLHYFRGGERESRRPALWFDTNWYLSQYASEIGGGAYALAHYLRNRKSARISPNPLFDVSYYLDRNRDAIRASGGDPFEHFLLQGHREGRNPSATFDLATYKSLKLSGNEGVNPLLHAIAGSVGYKMDAEPGVADIAYDLPTGCAPHAGGFAEVAGDAYSLADDTLVFEKAVEATADMSSIVAEARRRARREYDRVVADEAELAALLAEARNNVDVVPTPENYAGELKTAAAEFDFNYYLQAYDDVRAKRLDPLAHYFEKGWKDGYDPAPWFSTRYYLNSNPDIAKAAINPFWHYIVAGRREGREPKVTAQIGRQILSELKTPQERAAIYCDPAHKKIGKESLCEAFAKALSNAVGAALSISHDCYPLIVGGTQIFISDEQRKFNENGHCYFHLSPLRGGLTLEDAPAEKTMLRVVVNGEVVGAASGATVIEALEAAMTAFAGSRVFIVHCVLGHSLNVLLDAHTAFRATEAFYWLHDFSSVCTGFNLLRNDIDYCGAPPQGSMACGVCVYGESRGPYLRLVRRLFEACVFRVVSPSEATREMWARSTNLPHKEVLTVPHCRIEPAGIWRDTRPVGMIGQPAHPVRVAFIGYKAYAKGWGAFERIVEESCGVAGYAFYHFANKGEGAPLRRVKKIDASVTSQNRDAMIQALMRENIDITVNAALWPETFSYTLYEALAAGCDVATISDSGNVATMVRETGRGLVLEDEDALVDFFVSGAAIAWVRARAREGICRGALRHTGTTAALLFEDSPWTREP
ncbi:hypothetical protein [Methylocystis parvus]|uniref:hypothetical protein n=1 Tax=Methylocystis parvus TaxID=134 RepID=UPI003C79281D